MSDYISRQAAVEALEGWKISPIVLDPVPSADVRENVKGEWIETDISWTAISEDATVQIPSKECSICKKPIPQIMWNNFCSNCGADMRDNPLDNHFKDALDALDKL